MIKLKNIEIVSMRINGLNILSVYTLGQKVWPDLIDLILSCYSNGYWIDEYPWLDNLSWKD